MKKIVFILGLLMALSSFMTSCSEEEIVPAIGDENIEGTVPKNPGSQFKVAPPKSNPIPLK